MAKKSGLVRITVDVEEHVNDRLKAIAKKRTGRDKVGPMLRGIAEQMAEEVPSDRQKNSEINGSDNVLRYPGRPLAGKLLTLVKMLIGIFESGNQKAIRAVSENIDVFSEYARVMTNGESHGAQEARHAERTDEGRVQTSGTHRRDEKDATAGHSKAGKTGTDGG